MMPERMFMDLPDQLPPPPVEPTEPIVETVPPKPLLKLTVEASTVQSGTVPVRWCLDADTAAKLTPEDMRHLKVLLVVIPAGRQYSDCKHEQRSLHRLTEMMTYVEFQTPGENLIFATVLDEREAKLQERTLTVMFLHRDCGRYNTDVFEGQSKNAQYWKKDGRDLSWSVQNYSLKDQWNKVIVQVPEQVFAKPPPQWDRDIVNIVFMEGDAIDQCHHKKRRMLAYPLVFLVVIPFTTIFRTLAALIMMGLTYQKVRLSPILHPLKTSFVDVWENCPDQPLFNKFFRGSGFTFMQFSPLFLTVCAGVVKYVLKTPLWLAYLKVIFVIALMTVGIYGTIWSVIGIVMACVLLYKKFMGKSKSKKPKAVKVPWFFKPKGEMTIRERARMETALKAMTCNDTNPCQAGLKALPPEFQTINLRFLDLKARMCKPFAR